MITIDTGEPYGAGHIELPSSLFLALAKIHQLHEEADVRAGVEYTDHDGLEVWHVFTDNEAPEISGEIGEGYVDVCHRYIIDEQGTLRGVEKLVDWYVDDPDWFPIDVDPDTWKEVE